MNIFKLIGITGILLLVIGITLMAFKIGILAGIIILGGLLTIIAAIGEDLEN